MNTFTQEEAGFVIRPVEHRDQRMASERHAMEISKPDLYQEAIDRLVTLLGEARRVELNEPNAMTLATCDRNRRPTARTVSVKDVSTDGLVFYTNELSVKGVQMAEISQACAVFFWRRLMEQVIVEGAVKVLDEPTLETYWQTRTRESQLVAWASEQSKSLRDRHTLRRRVHEAKVAFREEKVPRPPYWLGYCLVPSRIEFWKAGWHPPYERVSYERSETGWTKQLLNP